MRYVDLRKNNLLQKTMAPIRSLARNIGFDIIRHCPSDFEPVAKTIIETVRPYTLVSDLRLDGVIEAAKYVAECNIPGAIVECGVWRGGTAMAAAMSLVHYGDTNREFYLYDTYAGMAQPTDKDVSRTGRKATVIWQENKAEDQVNHWAFASLEEVQHNMASTGYPTNKCHYIKGLVEETIDPAKPGHLPDQIAYMRLDTDWYESTKHELIHLYPRLAVGGVLIIDDYGDWQGSRQAVDEYIAEHNLKLLLNNQDRSRIAVKVHP